MSVTHKVHPSDLQTVIQRLSSMARTLDSEGRNDAAKSLETTIADLRWQVEEIQTTESDESRPARRRRP